MKLFRSLFFFFGSVSIAFADDDFILGMKGLQQAAKDPALLAQLMQDLNVSFCSQLFTCSMITAYPSL